MARINLGDVFLDINLRLADRGEILWRIGAPTKTRPSDRVIKARIPHNVGRKKVMADLKADQKFTITASAADEMGNPVELNSDPPFLFMVDDPNIVSLTDHGDGTATVAAVGPVGFTTVHCEGHFNDTLFTGDLLVSVVPGDVQRIGITPGAPEEVTPDE